MIARIIFLLLITALAPQLSAAQSQNIVFQEANAAFSKNDFSGAIDSYESLIAEHGYSPGVLYNLGNSYAQAGYPGLAILNYERALRLSPGNSDIVANLEKVRDENGLFTEESSFFKQLTHGLSMNQWGLLILASLTAIAATLALSLFRRVSVRTMSSVWICSGLVILLAITSLISLRQSWHCSIVISTTPLLISPFEGAAKIGTAREGRRVFPQQSHGGFVYVVSETGRAGWLPETTFLAVVPDRHQ